MTATIAVALLIAAPVFAQYEHPYQNPDLPLEDRVNDFVSLMTRNEKVAFLSSRPGLQRLGLRPMGQMEGLHGLATGGPGGWNRLNVVPTTIFPQSIGLGATWDVDILHQVGAIEGYEARYVLQSSKYGRGTLIIRTPNADLGRDIRWGRNEECYGEDPFLNGSLATAMIKGLQGDDPRYWQTASLLKHFLANSNENDRTSSSSDFDERLFMEYYSVPFRMGWTDGGAKCFMASYNAWNNVPMMVNPIINDLVVKDWGVDGIICTDAGGLGNLVTRHRYYPDLEHAAAGAIKAGINQFLDRAYRVSVNSALDKNLATEADIDEVIKGSLRVFFRLGLLDPPDRVPYANIGKEGVDPWTTDANKVAARLATQKSIVLLKNADRLLPLDRDKIKSIAVIGPRANEVYLDWYSGTPPYKVTPLDGIKNKVGERAVVIFAAVNTDGAAVQAAKSADVAMVCVGNDPNGGPNSHWEQVSTPSEGREAVDRKTITLDDQEELIKQVVAANPRTVVVLISSFPYAINWSNDNVPAILQMAHSSQEEGNALADVLFGDYNPAGRLVQTWPSSLSQLPPMLDYDIRHGRTYMYFKEHPLYPFGYGLSYTTFAYSNLRTSATTFGPAETVTVSVDVMNTGSRTGEEVVQLYVQHLNSSVDRPIKQLCAFQRVAIDPGQIKTVKLSLPASQLAYWDVSQKAWVIEKDRIKLLVGASSTDIKLTTEVALVQ